MITNKKRYILPTLAVISFLCMCFTISDLHYNSTKIHTNFLVTKPQFSTAFTSDQMHVEEVTSPLVGKTFIGFKEALAFRESRGNYFIISKYGYLGKYQFGKSALKFFGVKDPKAFLNSPEQQEKLFTLSLQRNKWMLRNEIKKYVGKNINGITITESGILAAAHLAGASSVKKFLKKEGRYAFADANGTTLQNYLKHFAGYDVTHIEAEKSPKFSV